MIDVNKWYEEGQKHKVAPLPKKSSEEKSIRRHAIKETDKKWSAKSKVLLNKKQ